MTEAEHPTVQALRAEVQRLRLILNIGAAWYTTGGEQQIKTAKPTVDALAVLRNSRT